MSIQFKTIKDLSTMLKNKDISNKELVKDTYSLIKSNVHLNAFVTLNEEMSLKKAEELDKILQPVHNAMFIESNPSPVKYAASLLGMCNPSVRLPLVEIRDETKKKVSEALKVAKLL